MIKDEVGSRAAKMESLIFIYKAIFHLKKTSDFLVVLKVSLLEQSSPS